MSHHAHDAVEDDHPGYSALANVSFVVAIPTLYLGGAVALGWLDSNESVLLTFAIIAAICVCGGILGAAWSTISGKKIGTGVAAVVVGGLALAVTAWAYSA
jgi:hypothetical protein